MNFTTGSLAIDGLILGFVAGVAVVMPFVEWYRGCVKDLAKYKRTEEFNKTPSVSWAGFVESVANHAKVDWWTTNAVLTHLKDHKYKAAKLLGYKGRPTTERHNIPETYPIAQKNRVQ